MQCGLLLVAVLAVSGCDLLFPEPEAPSSDALWLDTFQTYTRGAFPTENWIMSGNADAAGNEIVMGWETGEGHILQLKGIYGGNWSACAYRAVELGDLHHLRFRVRTSDVGGVGYHRYNAAVELTTGPDWTTDGRWLFFFGTEGNIRTTLSADPGPAEGLILGSYELGKWYEIEVSYRRSSDTVTLTYHINGERVGTIELPKSAQEEDLQYVGLYSGDTMAWFDDVGVSPDGNYEDGAGMQSAVVRAVNDGDTIALDREILGLSRVRYTGIDTPELTPAVECFATEATDANAGLVGGQRVWLELDSRTLDNVGRLLAYVRTSPSLAIDAMVNYRLLLDGYATIFKVEENWRYVDQFRDAQLDAAQNRRGMWSWCGDYAGADILIAAIQYWSDDEFVVVLNRGDQDVSLAEWTLSDDAGHTFTFPGTYDIQSWSPIVGISLSTRVVHSGPGDAQTLGNDLEWTDSHVWNEDGDTAYLRNAQGEIVHVYTYRGF